MRPFDERMRQHAGDIGVSSRSQATESTSVFRALNSSIYAHVRRHVVEVSADARRRPPRYRGHYWRGDPAGTLDHAYAKERSMPQSSDETGDADAQPVMRDQEHRTSSCFDNDCVYQPHAWSPRYKSQTSWKLHQNAAKHACHSWLATLLAIIVGVVRTYIGDASSGTYVRKLQDTLLCDWGKHASHWRTCERNLRVEIFAAPKPFLGRDAMQQERAIESWLALEPRPSVTLLGNASGYSDIVLKYRLDWIPQIDSTFLGVPMFNAIVSAANESNADIVILANADIILFNDIIYALRRIHRDWQKPWMAVAARWDINEVPAAESKLLKRRTRYSEEQKMRLVRHARDNGTLHTYGGIDVWAWNTHAGAALYDGVIPHFVFGRGKYDNWFTHEVISAGHRSVIDLSEACTVVHVNHDHHIVSDISDFGHLERPNMNDSSLKREELHENDLDQQSFFWNRGTRSKFELYINTYLAAAHGSYTNQKGTILHAPWKLQSCYEPDGLCMLRRKRPSICRCEHSAFVPLAQNDPFVVNDSRVIFCGLMSLETQQILTTSDSDVLERFVISGRVKRSVYKSGLVLAGTSTSRIEGDSVRADELHGALLEAATIRKHMATTNKVDQTVFGLPLLLERILDVIEQRVGTKKVLLTVLNSNHRKVLMRFTCAARRAGVFEQMVVAALDDDIYHHAVTRGLAVYLEDSIYHNTKEEAMALRAGPDSGSLDFFVSLRTRVANRLLKLQRNVLYADPDVMFVSNPFVDIDRSLEDDVDLAFLQRGSVAASIEPFEALLPELLSSAIFYARSRVQTEIALVALSVTAVRGKSRRAYEILCDKKRPWKESVHDAQNGLACKISSSGAKIAILPRVAFVDWTSTEVSTALFTTGSKLAAVHVALGGTAEDKIAAMQREPGLDLYDDQNELCKIDALSSERVSTR